MYRVRWFRHLNEIARISEQRPPQTKHLTIHVLWTALSVLHGFQYCCFVIQMIKCYQKSPLDKEMFTSMVNLVFPFGVAVLRGICLAYHREAVQKLKKYINSKTCQRDDAGSFELRRQQYQKVNRNLAAFHCITTANSVSWALTIGLHGDDVFKIPFKSSGWIGKTIDVVYALLLIPWCFTLWYSPTQFVPILSFFNTELQIVVAQFESLFGKVVANSSSIR